ncbi:exonuclease, DNA polymerase III, epsilon subunit family [Shewanella psychrophila]|uniref:DNA-directed DNA polymerase n=1 Tax=Shewanella psychrophila TaxID=225848 RepID=A0A1S6HK13_9GAMM|nr:3'-5' exonuclease [Shewanella psychrophila]AQS35857.1 exonuclease, DNA polymerase III, epsilon subunit family [Shewanella psychrophila]
MSSPAADSVIILDFETTGLSPNQGDRAIEIGAVRIENGIVVDTFQELMNPGFRVSGFIEGYTGISNTMLANAAPCEEVMPRFADFIGDHNLVAHNASFDQRFLDAELDAINLSYGGEFACSMLIARRLYQAAPNHKLGGLVEYKQIENDGVFHRALADSEMTAKLWLQMLDDMLTEHSINEPSFKLMQDLSRKPKAQVNRFLSMVG